MVTLWCEMGLNAEATRVQSSSCAVNQSLGHVCKAGNRTPRIIMAITNILLKVTNDSSYVKVKVKVKVYLYSASS